MIYYHEPLRPPGNNEISSRMIRQFKQNGSFYYQFILDGKRYNGVCQNCTTRKDAEAYERKIKREAARGDGQTEAEQYHRNELKKLVRAKNKTTLKDAFGLAEQKPRARRPSEKHAATKRTIWGDFLAFMHGEHPEIENLIDVTEAHAQEYIALLQKTGRYDKAITYSRGAGKSFRRITRIKNEGPLSARSLQMYQMVCAEVFSLLAKDAGLQENPFANVPRAKPDAEVREAFSPEELKLIYDNLDDFTRPLFMMAVWTGLREGDICTLKWAEVDLERRFIKRKTHKTGAVVQIPISKPLYTLLTATPRSDSEYVFPEHAKMYLTNSSGVSYRIKQFLEGLGIETTRTPEGRTRAISVKDLHSCRHTFCYYAGLAGIPLAVVQSIVGHMTPAMTEHYSAHASMEDKRRGMERLTFFEPEALPAAGEEPERAQLRLLVDSLPIEKIKKIIDICNGEL